MKIAGEYTFDAPQDRVWEALQDPNVLASIIPGAEGLEEIGENEYRGALKIKVGPVQGKYDGKITLSNIVPPDSYDIAVDGRGNAGFVNGGGGLQLEPQDDKTHMRYEGEARVGGRIASVGQRLLDSSAKAIIKQSLNALNEMLVAQETGGAALQGDVPAGSAPDDEARDDSGHGTLMGDVPAFAPSKPEVARMQGDRPAAASRPKTAASPAVEGPSQIEFAVAVGREVLADQIPEEYRPFAAGAAGGMLVLLLYLLLRR